MPWLSADVVANVTSKYAWSPIIWRDGYRHSQNFVESYWVGLDFDCAELSLEQAVNDFCDCVHVIGTTRNHRVLKDGVCGDRFRVVLRWDAPIKDRALYKYNVKKLIRRYDADKACSDLARHFFPCREIISVNNDGYFLEVEQIPEDYEERLRIKNAGLRRAGILSPWAAVLLTSTWEDGTKNTNCFRLGCEFARCGVSYEDAIARILEAPEYARRKIPPDLYEEITTAVANGFKAEREEEKNEEKT